MLRKKHPLTFSSISPWKMSRFSQNFQGMFRRKKAFHCKQIRYSFLLVTSCWHHISMFVNYGFYRWRQMFDKMLKHISWVFFSEHGVQCYYYQNAQCPTAVIPHFGCMVELSFWLTGPGTKWVVIDRFHWAASIWACHQGFMLYQIFRNIALSGRA